MTFEVRKFKLNLERLKEVGKLLLNLERSIEVGKCHCRVCSKVDGRSKVDGLEPNWTVRDGSGRSFELNWTVNVEGHLTKSGRYLGKNRSVEVDGLKIFKKNGPLSSWTLAHMTVQFGSRPSTYARPITFNKDHPLSLFWTVHFGPDSAVTLSNSSDNFPSSFKLSNFSQNFPTAAKLFNFSETFKIRTSLGSFQLQPVLSNFAGFFQNVQK